MRREGAGCIVMSETAAMASAMGEEVDVFPPGHVQQGAVRQELETGPRETVAALALQHLVEPRAQGVQVQDVGGGVGHLLVAEPGRAPVGALLGLGEVHPDQLLGDVLKPVAVGVGPRELGGDLGAVDGARHHPKVEPEHGDIKATVVEDLGHRRVGQQPLEVGGVVGGAVQAHHVGFAIAVRELHHAQGVAAQAQAHRLRIDRHRRRAGQRAVRQVALMLEGGHLVHARSASLVRLPI